LTAHLRTVLANGSTNATDPADIYLIRCLTALDPDQERLDLLLAALRQDTTTRAFRAAHQVRCECRREFDSTTLINQRFGEFHGNIALAAALTLVGLFDTRPLRGTHPENVNATGQRVCDDVLLHRIHDELRDLVADGIEGFAERPVAERDTLIARCRAALLPQVAARLLTAGLRMTHPEGGELKGAFPGWWQQELDSAKAEHKAVILLFTNTRTCAPCRGLEREVLSQPQWKAWAETHVCMVVLNGAEHENDPTYEERANLLFQLYDGGGIPSLFLIRSDGCRLGRRRAFDRNAGPAGYIAEFERVLAAGP
ncbi:MAG TPA: hypothetical protein VHX44_03235, partial [Planctomycetota bacterium]|nr:hypothetical protein [Planctomycetota bacterium]